MKKIFFLLFFVCYAFIAQASIYIEKIDIVGTERVERETVLSYLNLNEGGSYSQNNFDRALKNLYSTGLFSDVSFEINNNVLIVKLLENSIINKRVFEGNSKLDDKVLETEVKIVSGSIYNQSKVQDDVQRILNVYKKSGRYATKVEPKIIKREQNRVDLVFEIEEGPKAKINKINFIGNKRYSSNDLKNEIMSKESYWYRFFSSADTYDVDKTNYDKELLRRFYAKRGYADFNISSAIGELSTDSKSFSVTFVLDEGIKYKISEVVITSNIEGVDVLPIYKEVNIKKGDWYNNEEIETSINSITDALGVSGFAFVDVSPILKRNLEEKSLKLEFVISEGARVFVDRINIKGNTRTEDKVVRRELRLAEGDAFNASKIRASRRNIENLNYFSKTDISTIQKDNNSIDLDIDVEEKSTGTFNVGVGYSTINGAMIQAGISEANFQGKGQYLGVQASLAQKYSNYELNFTEPYFLDRRLSAGFDVFRSTQNYQDEGSYDSEVNGGRLRSGWKYTDNLFHNVRYTLKQDEITNVDKNASIYIKQEEGQYVNSSVGQTVTYDKRDSTISTKNGYLLSIGNDVAGAGGDEKYYQFDSKAYHFYTFADDYTFKTFVNGGYIVGAGNRDVRLFNRYNLGGYSLRGFRTSGIGARDKFTEDSLGGNWSVNGGTELSFPIGLEEVGIRGKTFLDFGILGKPDNFDTNLVDYSSKPRTSTGFGVQWNSPMGQIDLDFGFALNKEKYDKTEMFRLNFGTKL